MSTLTSIADLRPTLIQRIERNHTVADILGAEGGYGMNYGTSYGSEVDYSDADGAVIPARIAKQHNDLDPRIAVGASSQGLTRDNEQYSTVVRGRVIIDYSPAALETRSEREMDVLLTAVERELTTHADGWGYQDDSLSTEEYQFNDNLSRYVAVAQATFERSERHPATT